MTRIEVEEATGGQEQRNHLEGHIQRLQSALMSHMGECKHWTTRTVKAFPQTNDRGYVKCEWCGKGVGTRVKHVMTGEDYVAFLVERRDGGLRYLSLDNVLEIVWVEEADDALHFTRRSDAEQMVDNAPDEWDIHICDHAWIDGVPRDRIVPYSGGGC